MQLSSQVTELVRVKQSLLSGVRELLRTVSDAVDAVDDGPADVAAAMVDTSVQAPVARIVRPSVPHEADERLFEGRVELEAGPFPDFTSLSAFERGLSRLPAVSDVYVRRFTGERAELDVVLREPTPLVEALRAMPYDVDVRGLDAQRLGIDVQALARVAGG